MAEATWDGDTLYVCAACRGRCMQTVQNVLFAVPRRTAYVSAGRFLYDSGPTVTGKAVRGAADPEGGKRAAHAQERTVFSWSDPSQNPACARMPRQSFNHAPSGQGEHANASRAAEDYKRPLRESLPSSSIQTGDSLVWLRIRQRCSIVSHLSSRKVQDACLASRIPLAWCSRDGEARPRTRCVWLDRHLTGAGCLAW